MRKRKIEGLVLDLTRIEEGVPFTIDDVIVTASAPATVCEEYGSTTVGALKVHETKVKCDECGSTTVGALKHHDNKRKCGLCRAVADGRISTWLCERLRAEYAKPCSFCGDISAQKHFDHVNMFSKLDCVGFMVENGCDEASIVTEVDKCQILCKPCHRLVSSYEHRKGFFEKKRAFNKRLRAGDDVEALRIALYEEYSTVVEPYYARMRGGGGGLQGS